MNTYPPSIEVDRPLTPEESTLVRWLLEHADGDNAAFLQQLAQARVVRLCGCGCASVDFAIDGKRPERLAMRPLSDYQWRDHRGHVYGVFVFEQDGQLGGLEVWSIDGEDTPNLLPSVEQLVPYGAIDGISAHPSDDAPTSADLRRGKPW